MPSLLEYGMRKAKGAVRYLKPMPQLRCTLPEPKPLISGWAHRLPVDVEVASLNGALESDPLRLRLKWTAYDGQCFYGGEVSLVHGKHKKDTIHAIVTTTAPEKPGTFTLSAHLARGRRETELARAENAWTVQPLEESDGDYHYGEYMIGLDATTDCNLECIFCLRVFMEHIHNHHVTPEEMQALAEQAFDGCSGISLSLGAEPLLNRHLDELLNLLGEYPYVHTTMTTNGLTLSPKNTRLLVDNQYKEITVSIDGATKETFESVRINGKFDKLLQNLERLQALKREKGSEYPKLKINMALMKRNVHELPQFVEMIKRLGAEKVRFQYFMITHESLTEECLWFDKERSNRYLSEAIRACEEAGIEVDAPPLFREERKNGEEKQLRTQRCHWPWKGMLIDSDGNALPCCQWKGKPLGNVNEEGFQAVWNGEGYRQLRRDWITGDLNESCRNCSALMEGDVNDFSSFFAAEYEQIMGEEPPIERLKQNGLQNQAQAGSTQANPEAESAS